MHSKYCKVFSIAILAAVFLILIVYNYRNPFVDKVVAQETPQRTAWLVYWDIKFGEKDLARIGRKLEKLSYFGAYFDKNDKMFIPQELCEPRLAPKRQKGKYETYLTFINDKQKADGSVVLKDIEVLRRLFADENSMENHIDEIVERTLQSGCDGIEIDYERVGKDDEIKRSFMNFIAKLQAKGLENNLKLRVVLEPNFNFFIENFPVGPEYVVMVYNLYGLHSEPGPKANRDFIKKTLASMANLPGEKSIAFATGGCLWGSNGEKRLLTEAEAVSLADANAVIEPIRDEESQCLVYHYKNKDIEYSVWYADVGTLNYWIDTAKEEGVKNISLWRLGGNVEIDKIH